MEELVKQLVGYGLQGLLVGVMVLFLRHLVVIVIPSLIDRLSLEMDKERAACETRHRELLASLEALHANYLSALKGLGRDVRSLANAAGLREALRKTDEEEERKS